MSPAERNSLRRRAEAFLVEALAAGAKPAAGTLEQLAHDLAVHQTELEIQNDELRAAAQREEALLARYAELYHQAPVGLLTLDGNGVIRQGNQTFQDLLGEEAADLPGRSLAELLESPGREVFLARYRAIFRHPEGKSLDLRLRRRDGSLLDIRLTGRREAVVPPVPPPPAAGPHLLAVVYDISAEKRAEKAARAGEARHRSMLRTAMDGVWLLDPRGRFLEANDTAGLMLGYRREELFRLGFQDILAADPQEPAGVLLARVAQAGSKSLQAVLRRKDGCPLEVEVSITFLPDTREFVAHVRDISERLSQEEQRRGLEHQLQQSQKLESLGHLAGGVAHDMNNVLAAILMVVETLKSDPGEEGFLAKALGTIEKASTRGRDLVRSLTNFARKGLHQPEPVDLNELVREEAELLGRTTLQRVELVLDLEAALPPVLGERATLASAIMNLSVNALDAMPQGGSLAFRTRRRPGAQVELSVEDSGQGMAPEVLARALEPFFTTKPLGKGTGLGLALVYATAKAHGGSVILHSEPGRGTRVQIQLPASAAPPVPAAPAEFPVPAAALQILLVDDDELIRAAVPGLLGLLGHQVVSAAGGPEALALLENGLPVGLVILDLNMPGMNGAETLVRLRRLRPQLPVLIATGHLDDETAALLLCSPRIASIAKPYTADELGRKLRELA